MNFTVILILLFHDFSFYSRVLLQLKMEGFYSSSPDPWSKVYTARSVYTPSEPSPPNKNYLFHHLSRLHVLLVQIRHGHIVTLHAFPPMANYGHCRWKIVCMTAVVKSYEIINSANTHKQPICVLSQLKSWMPLIREPRMENEQALTVFVRGCR